MAKLTDTGPTVGFAWAQRAGGTRDEDATALAVNGPNVYVAGWFESLTVAFGSAVITNSSSFQFSTDAFVARLTDAGSTAGFAWAQRASGTIYGSVLALAVDGTSVYVAGEFNSLTSVFGATTLSNPGCTYLGFLAVLTDVIPAATVAARLPEPAVLFPNPARRTTVLHLPAGTADLPLTLSDAIGRVRRRYPAPASSEAVLDLGAYPPVFICCKVQPWA